MNNPSFNADAFDEFEEPTSDADLEIQVGEWVDLKLPKSTQTPQVIGMAFVSISPSVTLGIGTHAGASMWAIIVIVVIQIIGLIALVAVPLRKS